MRKTVGIGQEIFSPVRLKISGAKKLPNARYALVNGGDRPARVNFARFFRDALTTEATAPRGRKISEYGRLLVTTPSKYPLMDIYAVMLDGDRLFAVVTEHWEGNRGSGRISMSKGNLYRPIKEITISFSGVGTDNLDTGYLDIRVVHAGKGKGNHITKISFAADDIVGFIKAGAGGGDGKWAAITTFAAASSPMYDGPEYAALLTRVTKLLYAASKHQKQ